jgi:hypothetical protein
MRTSWAAILTATALVACTGTQGDLLRSVGDAASPDGPPVPLATWQIQLTGNIDTTVDATIYTVDIDPTPASTFAQLKAMGRQVICYFSAGTLESFRADANQFPTAVSGSVVSGYPNEHWLDVRDPAVRSIMANRIDSAVAKGCDGIHPSGVAPWENTGFPLTLGDSLSYATFLADTAHARNLSIGLVDGDDAFAQPLVSTFDWTVVWSCIGTQCTAATPFLQAGKPSYLIEYGDATLAASVCPAAKGMGLSAIIKHMALDAFRIGCP